MRDPNDIRTRMCLHSADGQVPHHVTARPMLRGYARIDHIVAFSMAGMECAARKKPDRLGEESDE